MSMSPISYPPNDVIFRQGHTSDYAYVILSGQVEIYRETPSGDEHVAILGPGHMFGEYGPADNAPRSASARAIGMVMLQPVVVSTDESGD